MQRKFIIGGVLILAAIVYLIASSTKAGAQYFLTVDELQAQQAAMTGRELLTHAGTVSHDAAMSKAHVEYEKYRLRQLEEPTEVEKHFIEAEGELKQIESSLKGR